MQNENARPIPLPWLAAFFFAGIIAFHLGGALAGKSLYRPIHLGTALEYSRGPVNLLKPVLLGFNANGSPTAQEFPIWQAAAGGVLKFTRTEWYGWANVTSLLFFATGLWPFFRLARRHVGERAAGWSLVFFLAQPLVVIAAGMGSTDGFCLAATLWFLFFADEMIHAPRAWVWWWPTTVFAALSAVSKLPFFMAAGLCSVFILLGHNARSARNWLLLGSAGLVAAAVFRVWTQYTDALMAEAVYPYAEFRIKFSPFARYWYFGDLNYRLNPGVWLKGGWRFLHATLGSLPLVALLATALLRPGNRMPKMWLLATFLTTLVFTHLVLVHWHYYLMCCPAVALLCGATLARWEHFGALELPRLWQRMALVAVALGLSAVTGVIATKIAIYYDSYPRRMADVIRQHTQPDDKLIIYGGDWGGEELFRAHRKGFYVMALESSANNPTVKGLRNLLNNETDLRRLKSLGYNKLVLMSESPVRFAAAAINPGSERRRAVYPEHFLPTVDSWPAVFRSEDIFIKEIPPE